VRHDVDDDSLAERDLYESPDPMILIRKMINTKNKELAHLFSNGFIELGFTIVATTGTTNLLKMEGILVDRVLKP
jgi:hypothetical protein